MPEFCGSLLCRLLPVSGFGLMAYQGFLVREAYVSVLVSGAGSLSSLNEVSRNFCGVYGFGVYGRPVF